MVIDVRKPVWNCPAFIKLTGLNPVGLRVNKCGVPDRSDWKIHKEKMTARQMRMRMDNFEVMGDSQQ